MSSKVNILHIVDHPGIGGAQNIINDLIRKTLKNHYFFALRKSPSTLSSDTKAIYIPKSKSKWNFFIIFKLLRFIRKHNIKILHLHLFRSTITGLCIKIFFLKNIILIHHEHGKVLSTEKKSHKIYIMILRLFQSKIDLFLAISNSTTECPCFLRNLQSSNPI